MVETPICGSHKPSPKAAQSLAADSRDLKLRMMMPESADGLCGPEHEIVSQACGLGQFLPTKNIVVDQDDQI
jgi:hypothetical protein